MVPLNKLNQISTHGSILGILSVKMPHVDIDVQNGVENDYNSRV